jgi:hypothetical protein
MASALPLQNKLSCLHPASSLSRMLAWFEPKANALLRAQGQRQRVYSVASTAMPWMQSVNKANVLAEPATGATVSIANSPDVPFVAQKKALASKKRLPLRIWQQTSAGHNGAATQRMVISGRMSEVCAELDRLAAAEARQH